MKPSVRINAENAPPTAQNLEKGKPIRPPLASPSTRLLPQGFPHDSRDVPTAFGVDTDAMLESDITNCRKQRTTQMTQPRDSLSATNANANGHRRGRARPRDSAFLTSCWTRFSLGDGPPITRRDLAAVARDIASGAREADLLPEHLIVAIKDSWRSEVEPRLGNGRHRDQ
jgi:hypothetical protein